MKEYKNEDGKWHRVNGAAVEWQDGDYSWYHHGECHRYYGLAGQWYGHKEYWIFGERIR